ncbi:MAG: hypothetical protein IKI51_05290 [Clostridia bacterium]|nr:hypothetical protein [Clostridia bacterium]
MKKMIYALILAAFLVAALTVMATADESEEITVDLIAVEVTAPMDGNAPNHSAKVKSNAYYVLDDSEHSGFEGGVLWEEEFGDDLAPGLTLFEEGKKYSVCVLIKLREGYNVGIAGSGAPDVKATINGNDAIVWWYDNVGDNDLLVVEYIFTAAKKADKPIADVVVTVTPPSANEKPVYEAETESENYTVYDVVWHDVTKSERLDENDTFIGGHEYTVYVALIAEDGYVFAVDENGMPVFIPMLNGVLASARRYGIETNGKKIVVIYDFPAIPEASTNEVTTAEPTTIDETTGSTAEPTAEPTEEITHPSTYEATTEAVISTPEATTANTSETTEFIITPPATASTSTAAAEPTGSIIVDLSSKDGCGSTLGAGASLAAVLALLITAAAVRKKKD